MSNVRINTAAELLGVSTSTLRSWERRLGYPQPSRTPGQHRLYAVDEIEALRDALAETGSIASAVEVARVRGQAPATANKLGAAFERFDEAAADRAMEESLAVRSIERSVEELLLPALENTEEQPRREAEFEFGCRWATGWIHSARRLAPPAVRDEAVVLLDASEPLTISALRAQALELFLRRGGYRVLLLSAKLAEQRFASALRALHPRVVVLCGEDARLDVIGRHLRNVLRSPDSPRLVGFGGAQLVAGSEGIESLSDSPAEALEALVAAMARR
ncbi:MerR family DNA-binding transcriptional regulator [Thermoleophilia bacterium SCSIO 60948]|nr:MerR family DNA-binding transcriptional regulator [Thermoleophilia bacterium SCSIO 60948]